MSQATKVDPATGVREEAQFFGDGPSRMFGTIHLPATEAGSAVLICSPFQSEFLANYRREVLLARELASRGLAVGRFHYRGTGHSDGDGAGITFDSMRSDAEEALSWLHAVAGVDRIGFLGTRWSALVAGGVAAGSPGSPIAFWDPAIEGRTYFQEIFRLRAMSDLSGGVDRSPGDVPQELRDAGFADVFGFAIPRSIIDSASERELVRELGADPRPVLLIEIGNGRMSAGAAAAVDRWRDAGSTVDVDLVEGREAWWFPGTKWLEETALDRTDAMVTRTARWFSDRLGGADRT
jgi:hypothetical protein